MLIKIDGRIDKYGSTLLPIRRDRLEVRLSILTLCALYSQKDQM